MRSPQLVFIALNQLKVHSRELLPDLTDVVPLITWMHLHNIECPCRPQAEQANCDDTPRRRQRHQDARCRGGSLAAPQRHGNMDRTPRVSRHISCAMTGMEGSPIGMCLVHLPCTSSVAFIHTPWGKGLAAPFCAAPFEAAAAVCPAPLPAALVSGGCTPNTPAAVSKHRVRGDDTIS